MYCIIVPRTFVQDVVIIVLFVSLCSPAPATPPPKEEEWSDVPSDVVHLSDSTFDDFVANNPSVLVMFYAPCKYLLNRVRMMHIPCVTKVYQPSWTEYKRKEKPSSYHNQGCGIKNKRGFFSLLDLMCHVEG